MTFAGINYWAVLVAGAIGFAFGGVWYRLLAEPWKAAHGFSTEQIRAHARPRTPQAWREGCAVHSGVRRRADHGLGAGRRIRPSRARSRSRPA